MTIVMMEGGHSSTAIGPLEVFLAAGKLWNVWTGEPAEGLFEASAVTLDGDPITCEGDIGIMPKGSIDDVEATDLIFVPSVGLSLDEALERNAALLPWLRAWRDNGALIAGVCTGVSMLAAAGLLDNKRATTHWGVVDEYRQRFPAVGWRTDVFITEDDGLLCGGGVYASLDLSLYIVEKFFGHEAAVRCAKSLLIDMPRSFQSSFAVLPLSTRHDDEKIRFAETRLQDTCRQDPRIAELSRELGMSPRNFVRRFKAATGETPLGYVQKLRTLAAKGLLEGTRMSIQEVARTVGYADAAFFRAVFKRHTGISPAGYRTRFGATGERNRPVAS